LKKSEGRVKGARKKWEREGKKGLSDVGRENEDLALLFCDLIREGWYIPLEGVKELC